MAKRKNKPGAGRPQFDGKKVEDVLAKLCEVWALDGSDAEAALFADISASSLSRYLDSHPEIAQRKAALKQTPFLIARRTIVKGVQTDADLALKYMERKCWKEFSERKEIVVDDKQRVEWSNAALNNPELADEISKLMGKIAKK